MATRDYTTESPRIPAPLVGFLTIEGVAVLIALVTPITPSKTGTKRHLAELFFSHPDYVQKAAIDSVFVNILLVVIALGVWICSLWSRGKRADREMP